MAKNKKQPIFERDTDIPTNYRTTGHMRFIQNIGEVPSKLQSLDEDGKIDSTYVLAAITKKFIYYIDKEYDNEYGTVMINKRRHLIADHFIASNNLEEVVGANNSILWMSRTVKVWQQEEYVKPDLLTPDVKKWLNKVDIEETLTKHQKKIYYAFLNNGPVKYTKAEALMAVLLKIDELPNLELTHKRYWATDRVLYLSSYLHSRGKSCRPTGRQLFYFIEFRNTNTIKMALIFF